jgi:hypothetical protein
MLSENHVFAIARWLVPKLIDAVGVPVFSEFRPSLGGEFISWAR